MGAVVLPARNNMQIFSDLDRYPAICFRISHLPQRWDRRSILSPADIIAANAGDGAALVHFAVFLAISAAVTGRRRFAWAATVAGAAARMPLGALWLVAPYVSQSA